jgi:hypothetical protein
VFELNFYFTSIFEVDFVVGSDFFKIYLILGEMLWFGYTISLDGVGEC